MVKRKQSTKSTESVKSKKRPKAATGPAAASQQTSVTKVTQSSKSKATRPATKKGAAQSAKKSTQKSAASKSSAGQTSASKTSAGKSGSGKSTTRKSAPSKSTPGKAAPGKSTPGKLAQQDAFAEYLQSVPAAARPTLQSLRRTISAVVPEATATLSYGIAAFRLQGRLLLGIGATAQHCAIYLMSAKTVRNCAELLADFDTSVGTVRFPHRLPPTPDIVRTLVETRLAEQNQPVPKKMKKTTEE